MKGVWCLYVSMTDLLSQTRRSELGLVLGFMRGGINTITKTVSVQTLVENSNF